MMGKILRDTVLAVVASGVLVFSGARADTSIDVSDRFAWGPNAGWIDWQGDPKDGAFIARDFAFGYLYAANVGWIDMGDGTPTNGFHYGNDAAFDYGVNVDSVSDPNSLLLSGYAYSANTGWVNFGVGEQAGAGNEARVDRATGVLKGYAWGANTGWLPLESPGYARVRTDLSAIPEQRRGPPQLLGVVDAGEGYAELEWIHYNLPPTQFLALTYDVYADGWWPGGPLGSIWSPFPVSATTGTLRLYYAGGYYHWLCSQYEDGSLYPNDRPRAFVLYSGEPNLPVAVTISEFGSRHIILQWKPEKYGTWLYWLGAFHVQSNEFVSVAGPLGSSVWHYVVYPNIAQYFQTVEFDVPLAGQYWFFIIPVAWDGTTWGEAAGAFIGVL